MRPKLDPEQRRTRVTITLAPGVAGDLDRLVGEGVAKNRSALVEMAIDRFLKDQAGHDMAAWLAANAADDAHLLPGVIRGGS